MWVLRRFLFLILLAPGASAATPQPKAAVRPKAAFPNIILITLDTTRADRMGFLGSQRGLTPNLDALARQGVVFSRAYSHVPLTPPSHATILTGTYPQFNHLTYMGEPLNRDLPYIPDILHRRGYRTGAFVASMILDPANVTAIGFGRGFDTYDAGFHQRTSQEDRYHSVERRADVVVSHALGWLSQHPAGPFFLWVHCYDPHGPYDPPEPYKSRYASEPYDGEIAYMDAAMGKLMSGLKQRGLYDGAMIAVMADHGEAFGEHGERHHGIFLYDETMHVPLVIKLPGGRSGGSRVDSRVRLVDIAPTVLQQVGIPVPPVMQGESLLSLMKPQAGEGQSAATEGGADRPAYGETVYAYRAFGWSVLRSWRTGKYLYVQAPKRELYDQSTDLKAAHDLATASTAVADTLAGQLEGFRLKTSSAGGHETNLSSEQAQSLQALGYLPSTGAANSASQEGGTDPKDKIELANLLTEALFDVQDERYQDAVPKLEKVLKEEPNTPLAYLDLGQALVHLKEYEQAVPLLREAVKRLPDNGLAHYTLGRALVETKDWADAAPEFESAIAHSEKSAELHFYLAVVYERTQRAPDAIKEFKNVLQLDPKHFRANLLLGRLYGMGGDATSALPYLRKAVKVQPDSSEAHQFLGSAYAELGQSANARREYEEAKRLTKAGGGPPQP
jgi:arylsulfatase A-like enzyme/Tfp pilus assembly protein PilF